MPIDLQCEQVMSLQEAAGVLPRQPGGKKVHISTLYRWATAGVRGTHLETLRIGGRVVTSVEALQRFAERCSATDPARGPRSAIQRRREIKRAEEELGRAGI